MSCSWQVLLPWQELNLTDNNIRQHQDDTAQGIDPHSFLQHHSLHSALTPTRSCSTTHSVSLLKAHPSSNDWLVFSTPALQRAKASMATPGVRINRARERRRKESRGFGFASRLDS